MTWKRDLLWELKWSAVEALCIGIGLLFNQFTEQGLWFLSAFLCVDLVVRLRHYCDPLTYSGA